MSGILAQTTVYGNRNYCISDTKHTLCESIESYILVQHKSVRHACCNTFLNRTNMIRSSAYILKYMLNCTQVHTNILRQSPRNFANMAVKSLWRNYTHTQILLLSCERSGITTSIHRRQKTNYNTHKSSCCAASAAHKLAIHDDHDDDDAYATHVWVSISHTCNRTAAAPAHANAQADLDGNAKWHTGLHTFMCSIYASHYTAITQCVCMYVSDSVFLSPC